ncbi:MAG: ribonuclease E/G [Rhizobiaceae bacterium]
MANKMLIDASHPEETRVVVVRGNRIEEFDFESQHKKQLRGNIYLARVTRVEPSLQAAFVEYGGNRHGFLAFSEIHPDYYQIPYADRQALLEAEAAEHQEDDEEDDEQPRERRERDNGRNRRRDRNRDRNKPISADSAENDELSQSSENDSPVNGDETPTPEDESVNDLPTVMEMTVEPDEVSEDIRDDSEQPRSGNRSKSRSRRDQSDDDDDDGHIEEQEVIESVGAEDAMEEVPTRRRVTRKQYKIQEVIKRRQVLLVQVVKEERGNKGAALTTYLSLAGRYSVLMPNTGRGGGISRKITSAQDRKRLKDVVKDLEVPKGMGVILRTAGANRTKVEIKRDYEYLMRAWETVRTLTLQSSAPALVYEEGSLIKRSIRDLYNKDIGEILVAGENGYREAKDFMRMLMPSHAKMVQPYREPTPIFARAGIEAQLDKMLQPQVTLKSGGYIIINQTEALVSIDVNSGRSTREHSIEDTALQTNLEAAEEVARQLRLRDLAGLIVIDFIDMEEKRNNRSVEKRLKDNLKNDRARIQVGRISHFGLLEMSRQRIRASVLESTMQVCAHCGGNGHVRSQSSVGLHVIRSIEEFLLRSAANDLIVKTPISTAMYILNQKRDSLIELEGRFGVRIAIEADDKVGTLHLIIERGGPASGIARGPILPAYDDSADDDLDIPMEDEIEEESVAETEALPESDKPAQPQAPRGDGEPRRKRRRRRRGRNRGEERADQTLDANGNTVEASDDNGEDDDAPAAAEDTSEMPAAEAVSLPEAGEQKKRRRRGGREKAVGADAVAEVADAPEAQPTAVAAAAEPDAKPAKSRSRKKKVEPAAAVTEPTAAPEPEAVAQPVTEEAKPARARASRRKPEEEAGPVEPIVSTASTETGEQPSDDKPRKGGWWQKRGFF